MHTVLNSSEIIHFINLSAAAEVRVFYRRLITPQSICVLLCFVCPSVCFVVLCFMCVSVFGWCVVCCGWICVWMLCCVSCVCICMLMCLVLSVCLCVGEYWCFVCICVVNVFGAVCVSVCTWCVVFHELITFLSDGGEERHLGYCASVNSFVYPNDLWNGPFGLFVILFIYFIIYLCFADVITWLFVRHTHLPPGIILDDVITGTEGRGGG